MCRTHAPWLERRERQRLWHPVFEEFARYCGFTPRARQPYRAQTNGKVEAGGDASGAMG